MYKTRTRMVSFRLSEDEYERLKDLSLSECARSVSEFARAALCRLPAGQVVSGEPPVQRVDKLEGAVRQLKFDVFALRQMVESLLSGGNERSVVSPRSGVVGNESTPYAE